MTKLEKKLLELNYELAMTQKFFVPENKIVKTYSKQVGEDKFNNISVCNDKICNTKIADEEVMQKDLEILKECE